MDHFTLISLLIRLSSEPLECFKAYYDFYDLRCPDDLGVGSPLIFGGFLLDGQELIRDVGLVHEKLPLIDFNRRTLMSLQLSSFSMLAVE